MLEAMGGASGGNTLGKLEMKWRNAMGEVGRLQTQQIMGMPDSRREVELAVRSRGAVEPSRFQSRL